METINSSFFKDFVQTGIYLNQNNAIDLTFCFNESVLIRSSYFVFDFANSDKSTFEVFCST